MATVKIKFRPSSVNAKEGILFYQVIHNRVARQINTGCKIYPAEWDNLYSRVVIPQGTEESRYHYLHSLENRIKEDTTRLRYILARLDRTDKDYSADKVVELFFISPEDGGFISFCQNLINQLKQIGKVCTAETYATSLNSFIRFRGDRGDIPLGEVDTDLMAEYEVYLKSNGICLNSSSYYMRNLRAMYNRAVEKELVVQRNPFKYVYTGIDKTVKRAVSAKVIRQIRDLDLVLYPLMDYARDIFMFSFYTRGMSFIDMAYLKKKDLKNGILSYRRQKTKQQLLIKWEQPMQYIIDKYDTSGTPYLNI